ncbi:MAG: TonB-dependent receptor [Runella slithyformis]|nr:MAG: TonB-dependent receptor [Runella slithyformis]TAF80998.1 MAG: TonB-dependent receptor [Runella slithyformis]TAG19048.1 MAG: TonB-dependent receptor [Cytophagales bacterium]TAG38330.1 MAG: TonB-dependent receptor [Cytophagia bacterium]TAG79886.1 MAG: TonB-dependent receptor [Cytophagales bacterium]
MKTLFFFLLFPIIGFAQATVKGKVTDQKGEALPGANIQIEGSYDGASANEKGEYTFKTDEMGEKTLVVSVVGYQTNKQKVLLKAGENTVDFVLKESINTLSAVTITAGTFEASDEKRMVMLKPLDIVTTAGGGADITAVMQFLPGSNRVGEQEGLFVRGGSANETKTVIDGMIVQNPFFSSTPDVPQRGRFSPFMFKGTAFSTGGYSAQYGQALSSVLLLQTQDKTSDASSLNLNANMAGLSATYTHKGWITGTLYYSNLSPLFKLVKTNLDFEKIPESVGASITINQNLTKTSTLKVYGTYADGTSGLRFRSFEQPNESYVFSLRNKNTFINSSYRNTYNDGKWILLAGLSYSYNKDLLNVGNTNGDRFDERTQGRIVVNRLFGAEKTNTFSVGVEHHAIRLGNIYNQFNLKLNDNYSAFFAETEFYASPKLAVRFGLRGEYTSVIGKYNAAPRLSLAQKTGQYSQVSLAAGRFYQTPEKDYLYRNPTLNYELADHLILNYQRIKNDRTFRIEAFTKQYGQLVFEQTTRFDPNPYRFPTGPTDNSGKGFANGFDVFFRDKKTLKNADIWLTYSYLDTERRFRNYSQAVMPAFATNHNFSAVYKQFFPTLGLNAGLTYTYTSGRPVYALGGSLQNPDITPSFQNLSFATSYIKAIKNHFLVFYLSVDNVLARKNVFGYRYSQDGTQRFEVKPLVYRTFFAGVSWSIGKLDQKPKEANLDF